MAWSRRQCKIYKFTIILGNEDMESSRRIIVALKLSELLINHFNNIQIKSNLIHKFEVDNEISNKNIRLLSFFPLFVSQIHTF